MVDVSDDALLKEFFAEVGAVERDNEVIRVLSCFKLNPFEHLNLAFDSGVEDVKKQYRKISLMIHPDKCKHPKAKEAFDAIAKAQQLLSDNKEREYLVSVINNARDELRAERKKKLKKDNASSIKSVISDFDLNRSLSIMFAQHGMHNLMCALWQGRNEEGYETSEEFKQLWKEKVRQILTDQEWRRRRMQLRITEEEGRLKKDEEETRELNKRKKEHEQKWEETRETRVSSWRDFQKGGKKSKKGELKPPKLKTEDPNKSYVQRPVKR